MRAGFWISMGAFFGFLGVALGAFGAHALSTRFSDYEKGIWQTAVFYQLIHALSLLVLGILTTAVLPPEKIASANLIGWLFTVGILLFSGSLFALSLSGMKGLGAITPIGGVAFLTGWALLARLGMSLQWVKK